MQNDEIVKEFMQQNREMIGLMMAFSLALEDEATWRRVAAWNELKDHKFASVTKLLSAEKTRRAHS